MTVKEFIKELQKCDEDSEVLVAMQYYEEPFCSPNITIENNKNSEVVFIDGGNQESYYGAGHFLADKDPLFTERIKGFTEDMKRIYCSTGGSSRYLTLYDAIQDDLDHIKNNTNTLQQVWKSTYTQPSDEVIDALKESIKK